MGKSKTRKRGDWQRGLLRNARGMVGAREARTEMPAQAGMRYERIANPEQPDASEIKNTCQNNFGRYFLCSEAARPKTSLRAVLMKNEK